jgi:hypothetical protein
MREQNIITAYEFIELYSELLVVRLPIIEKQSAPYCEVYHLTSVGAMKRHKNLGITSKILPDIQYPDWDG